MPSCSSCLFPLSVAPLGALTSLPTAVLGFTPHGLCWPRRSPRPPPGLPASLWLATALCPHPVESPSKSLPESQTHSWPMFPDNSRHPGPLLSGLSKLWAAPTSLPSTRLFPFPKHQLSPPWPQCPALPRTHLHSSAWPCTAWELLPRVTTRSLGAPVHTLPGRSGRFSPIPSVTLYSLQEHFRTQADRWCP